MQLQLTNQEEKLLRLIGEKAQELGTTSYAIGGFVRDKVLGRTTKDIDIVCIGDGIALAENIASAISPNTRVHIYKNFGTAHLKYQDIDVEFVGARKESYQENSRKPYIAPGNLADDQNRRDFTINALAIAIQPENFGAFLDPFNGLTDLQSKTIKTPLDPDITFSDDPLRMMRAIRFATQLGFEIEATTFHSIKKNAARIKIISQERITDELNKIILSQKPSTGFDLLYQSGLLSYFFPQMVDLVGATFIEGKGHKDNFYHTLQVLDNVAQRSPDLWLRWAAILHDIGKPATKKFEEGHGWTFHGHEVVGERMIPKIFKQLKLPLQDNMKLVAKLVALHLRPISLSKEEITDSAMRRLLFDAGIDLEYLMILCESDITSKNKQKVARFLQNFELVKQRLKIVEEKDHIRNWEPPVNGNEIMELYQLKPSREVGILKTALREAILDGNIPNDRNASLNFIESQAQLLGLKSYSK